MRTTLKLQTFESRELVDRITADKLKEKVANATVNRVLAVLRSVLRKMAYEWEWLDRIPKIRLLPEPKRRLR